MAVGASSNSYDGNTIRDHARVIMGNNYVNPTNNYYANHAQGEDSKKQEYERKLLQAAAEGQTNRIARLLKRQLSYIDCKDAYGLSPIHHAVLSGTMSPLEHLVDQGADVNAKSDDWGTPLHLAVLRSNVPAVLYLAKRRRADLYVKCGNLGTISHCAYLSGNEDILKILLELDALPKQRYTDIVVVPREMLRVRDDRKAFTESAAWEHESRRPYPVHALLCFPFQLAIYAGQSRTIAHIAETDDEAVLSYCRVWIRKGEDTEHFSVKDEPAIKIDMVTLGAIGSASVLDIKALLGSTFCRDRTPFFLDGSGITAVIHASLRQHDALADFLVGAHMDIDHTDHQGRDAFWHAQSIGQEAFYRDMEPIWRDIAAWRKQRGGPRKLDQSRTRQRAQTGESRGNRPRILPPLIRTDIAESRIGREFSQTPDDSRPRSALESRQNLYDGNVYYTSSMLPLLAVAIAAPVSMASCPIPEALQANASSSMPVARQSAQKLGADNAPTVLN